MGVSLRCMTTACGLACTLFVLQACETRPRRSSSAIHSPLRPEVSREPSRAASKRVTIDKKDASIWEIVEEIRQRTGLNVIVESPLRLEVLRLSFSVDNQPVPLVIEAFARQAELEFEWIEPASVLLRPAQRVTFDFKDADVRVVLDLIMRVSGASIIVSPSVEGTITMSVNNVPWKDVLMSLARTAGMVIVHEDSKILRILKE